MTEIIGVANQKGGVGKTTTAVNIAACLAAAGHRTLLIDMDSQGSASSAIGIDRGSLLCTMYEVLCLGRDPGEALTSSMFEHLSVLPSSISLSGVEIELADVEGWEFRLKHAIESLADGFEYVIIDGPPSLGLLQVMTFVATKRLLVPVQCEFLALEGLTLLLDSVTRVQQGLNPDLELFGILLTMHTHTNLSRQVMADVREHFGDTVFKTAIPRSVRLSEAPSFGQPIILYDIRSAGAEAYINLCEEVLHECQKTRPGPRLERPALGECDESTSDKSDIDAVSGPIVNEALEAASSVEPEPVGPVACEPEPVQPEPSDSNQPTHGAEYPD